MEEITLNFKLDRFLIHFRRRYYSAIKFWKEKILLHWFRKLFHAHYRLNEVDNEIKDERIFFFEE